MPPKEDVIVIGAGLSGLACANRLKKLGARVRLVEQAERAGGVIQSQRIDGYLIERGPNSAQGTPALLALVEELGILDQLVEGDPKAPAYVYFGGALHRVPTSPPALLKTRLLSGRGKLRLLAEPFIRKRREGGDESLADFATRRLGREVAERLVAPFVAGVYAGDIERLSAAAAFPRLANLESGYGSLFRGMRAAAREARRARRDDAGKATPAPRRLCSFREGMQTLTEALAGSLGEALLTGCGAVTVGPAEAARRTGEGPRFTVNLERAGRPDQLACEHLVIATPARTAARMVAPFSSKMPRLLEEFYYVPLSVVYLAVDEAAVGVPLDGFGFLAAPAAGLRILGCIWNTSLFAGRAPAGKALLTTFVGGARFPELARASDAELAEVAGGDLRRVLGISGAPETVAVQRWERAIPQYNLGHAERRERLAEHLSHIPGLHLTGNYLQGVSVGDCIEAGERLAQFISGEWGVGSGE